MSPNPAILLVLPATGGDDAAGPEATILTFARSMMPGMEQDVDLHQGGVGGPVVPMTCGWNAEQTTLTCTPAGPLAPGSQYTLHVGEECGTNAAG